MSQEIERKFLVTGEYKSLASKSYCILQGYISSAPDCTVRIRIKGERGFITIKGKSNASGMSRYEWEKEIPINEAQELLKLCKSGIIEKTRYEVIVGNHTFEVDEFYGENEGLTLAEVELKYETESFLRPEFLGDEVTGDKRYYNGKLSAHPFKSW